MGRKYHIISGDGHLETPPDFVAFVPEKYWLVDAQFATYDATCNSPGGESAGGGSVHMLMTSPLATGLFQRAVVESGGGRNLLSGTGLHEGRDGRPSAEEIGVAFAKKNGITGDDAEALEKLRALPAETVVDGLNMASMGPAASTYPGPMIDGKIVTDTVEHLYKEGKYQHVPMIVGANSMDIGFTRARNEDELFAPFGANSESAKKAYDAAGAKNFMMLGMKVAADQFMMEPARFVAQTLSSQGVPVWEFRFAYVAGSMRSQWPGAPSTIGSILGSPGICETPRRSSSSLPNAIKGPPSPQVAVQAVGMPATPLVILKPFLAKMEVRYSPVRNSWKPGSP